MITIDMKSLREALSGLGRLNLKKQSTPVLGSVHICADKGWLTLTGTNLDERLSYQMRSEDTGECLVSYENLRAVAKGRSTSAKVWIEPGRNRHRIGVEDGASRSQATYSGPKLDGFPPSETGLDKLTVLPGGAMTHILDALPTASTDPTRTVLGSILVEPDAVVSTNGKQLFRANSLKLDIPDPVLLPASKTIKVFDPDKTAHLYGSKGDRPVYRLMQGPWEWTCQAVEGKYPDYHQVFPKKDELRVKVTLSESDVSLIEELGKVSELTQGNALTGLRVDENRLLLMVGSKDNRQIHPLRPEKIEGDGSQSVFFDYSFLLLGLSQGLRELSLRDELSSIVMEGNHRMNLFMPVRAKVDPSEWKLETATRVQTEEPAEKVQTEPANNPQSDNGAEDPLDVLVGDAMALKNQLRELTNGLNGLVKAVRQARKERLEKDRDHLALKRTLRSLQRLGV